MPSLDGYLLRPAQFEAINNIERSLVGQTHSRSLVQMATGAGKTRMAVTECYRLIKYGGFNRVLFLVDRNNLGDQTLREFSDYTTPTTAGSSPISTTSTNSPKEMTGSSKVMISTIQRAFSVLRQRDL